MARTIRRSLTGWVLLVLFAPVAATALDVVTLYRTKDLPLGSQELGCDMAVASTGDLLLQIGGNLYDPARRQWLLNRDLPERPTLKASPGRADIMMVSRLSSFALTPDNIILAIDGNQLGLLARGNFEAGLTLPNMGMKLAMGSRGRLYFYGGDGADAVQYQGLLDELAETEARLGSQSMEAVRLRSKLDILPRAYLAYRLGPDGESQLLFEALDRISDLVVTTDGVVFSAGAGIYRYRDDIGLQPLLVFPDGAAIDAIEQSPGEALYFLRNRDLYGLLEGSVTRITKDIGDNIRFSDGRLYVCDARRGRLGYLTDLTGRAVE